MKILLLLITIFLSACSQMESYPEGKKLYFKHCSGCHGKNGEGLELLIPPLSGAEIFLSEGPNAACWITKGMKGKIIVKGIEFDNVMPPIDHLSHVEIANILNYALNSWGNKHDFITPDEIKSINLNCP